MRLVIFGAGAVGGVVGARLYQAGYQVQLIARGAHHDAIAAHGLTLETPRERVTLPIAVASTPAHVSFSSEDIVILATKSQDTDAAIEALRRCAPASTPVVCMQNGVENERIALRFFDNVYGAVVMAPNDNYEPGVVQAFGIESSGKIHVGRYPQGVDDRCQALAAALRAAHFSSQPSPKIMDLKHAKLLGNLANAVTAICDVGADDRELRDRVREEGRSVLRAAGIAFDRGASDAAAEPDLGIGEIQGRTRGGGSTWQSIQRGSASVETDYLNGEIVLQGRLNGVPTPVNDLLCALMRETLRDGREPGWLSPSEVLALL